MLKWKWNSINSYITSSSVRLASNWSTIAIYKRSQLSLLIDLVSFVKSTIEWPKKLTNDEYVATIDDGTGRKPQNVWLFIRPSHEWGLPTTIISQPVSNGSIGYGPANGLKLVE